MDKGQIKPALQLPLKYFVFIIALWLAIYDFLLSASFADPLLRKALYNLPSATVILSLVFLWLLYCFNRLVKEADSDTARALAVMSPIALLFLWPAQNTDICILLPFLIVIVTQILFHQIIFSRRDFSLEPDPLSERVILSSIILLYFIFFASAGIRKFDAFAAFNPKDYGLFDQIFWNSARGRLFVDSTYGHHFSCHNSPFFILFMPFYYFFPGPHTLLILKSLILALSAITVYLIARDILKDISVLPLVLAFLFSPFIAGQNFTCAHEMGLAPPFILLTYYYFRKERFFAFLGLLFITVSAKETMALLAVMFGIYAFLKKREARWVVYPILIGGAWFLYSVYQINIFQNIYRPHSDSAWYFVYLKKTLAVLPGNGIFNTLIILFFNSNLGHLAKLNSSLLIFLPLGFIFSLFGSATILGLPELLVNLFSGNSNMFSPRWHYSITLYCFILIGAIEGIDQISQYLSKKGYLRIGENRMRFLLSVFLFSCTLLQSYLWIDFAKYKPDAEYVKEAKEALSLVPLDASISVPLRLVTAVSERERYSIAGFDAQEDYILVDGQETRKALNADISCDYGEIFRSGSVILYQRKPRKPSRE